MINLCSRESGSHYAWKLSCITQHFVDMHGCFYWSVKSYITDSDLVRIPNLGIHSGTGTGIGY